MQARSKRRQDKRFIDLGVSPFLREMFPGVAKNFRFSGFCRCAAKSPDAVLPQSGAAITPLFAPLFDKESVAAHTGIEPAWSDS